MKGLTVECHLEGCSFNPDCSFDVMRGLWIFHESYPFALRHPCPVPLHTLDFMYMNHCLSHMRHGIQPYFSSSSSSSSFFVFFFPFYFIYKDAWHTTYFI